MAGKKYLAAFAALTLGAIAVSTAAAANEPTFDCGTVHTSKAQRNPNPNGKPPLLLGDSTALLPIPNLNRVGYSVNARGCRGFRESINIARRLRKEGRLPHLVVTNTYSNGGVNPGLISSALKVLGPKRVLGLVTAYNADTGEAPAPDTDVIVTAASEHPGQIVLLDWVGHSLPHHTADDWFLPDLFHPNFAGAEAYARFLKRALRYAPNGKFPR